MLGMSFLSFLTLLVIGTAVGAAFHWILRYRYWNGFDAFVGEIMLGWFGAWLGSPVLGHWLWKVNGIYVVPAILGAIVAVHLDVLCLKALWHVPRSGRTLSMEHDLPSEKIAKEVQATRIAA